MWGRERTYGGIVERRLENLISPGYYEKKNYTEVDKRIEKLYNITGDSSVFPPSIGKTITINGETRRLSGDEHTRFSKLCGRKRYALVKEVMGSDEYKNASVDEKISMIEKCYRKGREWAKEKIFGNSSSE